MRINNEFYNKKAFQYWSIDVQHIAADPVLHENLSRHFTRSACLCPSPSRGSQEAEALQSEASVPVASAGTEERKWSCCCGADGYAVRSGRLLCIVAALHATDLKRQEQAYFSFMPLLFFDVGILSLA